MLFYNPETEHGVIYVDGMGDVPINDEWKKLMRRFKPEVKAAIASDTEKALILLERGMVPLVPSTDLLPKRDEFLAEGYRSGIALLRAPEEKKK